MKLLVQRVLHAHVDVDGKTVGAIGLGLLVFVGIGPNDTPNSMKAGAVRLAKLRIFEDEAGKINRSADQVGAALLAVPQFTLYADVSQNRPGFSHAAPPAAASPLFDEFVFQCRATDIFDDVQTGKFGAEMKVGLLNDGPFTLWLDLDLHEKSL